MKKRTVKPKVLVQERQTTNLSLSTERLIEKLHFVQLAQVRRHSRVLYIPLDAMAVHWSRIKKGDTIKYSLLEIRRAPEVEEE